MLETESHQYSEPNPQVKVGSTQPETPFEPDQQRRIKEKAYRIGQQINHLRTEKRALIEQSERIAAAYPEMELALEESKLHEWIDILKNAQAETAPEQAGFEEIRAQIDRLQEMHDMYSRSVKHPTPLSETWRKIDELMEKEGELLRELDQLYTLAFSKPFQQNHTQSELYPTVDSEKN